MADITKSRNLKQGFPATLIIKTIAYGSGEYEQQVQLRDEVLRAPLGLSFSTEFLARDADNILIGAFSGSEIIGCCQLAAGAEGIFQLRQMAVTSKLQGSGIGTQLIQFAESCMKQKGGNKIMLHAREVAAGFYTKLGYTTIGELFMEVGLPHVEMIKDV